MSAQARHSGVRPSACVIVSVTLAVLCSEGRGQDSRRKSETPTRLLVKALRNPKTRADAAGKLVMRGKAAVGRLVSTLSTEQEDEADVEFDNTVLWILRAMGRDALGATVDLVDILQDRRTPVTVEMFRTAGTLALFLKDSRKLYRALTRRSQPRRGATSLEQKIAGNLASHRTNRGGLDRPGIFSLANEVQRLNGNHALIRFQAIERLAYRGAAAQTALPALLRLLGRPNPLVLATDMALNQRRAVAATILRVTIPRDADLFALLFQLDQEQAQRQRALVPARRMIDKLANPPHRAAARSALAVLVEDPPAFLVPAPARKPTPAPPRNPEVQDVLARLGNEQTDRRKRRKLTGELAGRGRAVVPYVVWALRSNADDEADPEDDPRRHLFEVLRRLGPDAAAAAPVLFEMATELPVHLTPVLLETLAATAPWGVDYLTYFSASMGGGRAALNGVRIPGTLTPKIQTAMYRALQLHWDATSVDPTGCLADLVVATRHGSVGSREAAVAAIQRRGASAQAALPTLAKALTDNVPKQSVVRAMENSISHGSRDVSGRFRTRVALAMLTIGPNDPRTAPAHAYLLQHHDDTRTRMAAAMALGRLGEAAQEQVAVLVAALDDRHASVILEAATALGMIGAPARQAVPKLQELARGKNRGIAVRAQAALRRIKRQEK